MRHELPHQIPNPQKTFVLFDFDGTMVETEQQVITIINTFRKPFGLPAYTLETFRNRGPGKGIIGFYLARLFSPVLLQFIQNKQSNTIMQMRLEPGLLRVIRRMHQVGYRLGIVSSNSLSNVTSYLDAHKLTPLFECVKVAKGLYGKGEIISQLKKAPENTSFSLIYVGDEVRDVEAAKAAGVKIVAVTWGYEAKDEFEACSPDWMVNTPHQLFKLFIRETWWQRLSNFLNKKKIHATVSSS